jgi:hypothetical protein
MILLNTTSRDGLSYRVKILVLAGHVVVGQQNPNTNFGRKSWRKKTEGEMVRESGAGCCHNAQYEGLLHSGNILE